MKKIFNLALTITFILTCQFLTKTSFAQTGKNNSTYSNNLKDLDEEQLENFFSENYNFNKILNDLSIRKEFENEKLINFRRFAYYRIKSFYDFTHEKITNKNYVDSKMVVGWYRSFLDTTVTIIQKDKPKDDTTTYYHDIPTPKAGSACNNMDFENGNLNGWYLRRGNVPGGTQYSFVDIGAGSIGIDATITSGTTTDAVCGIPTVNPNGGSYSCKLGDGTATGSMASRMSKSILVTASNYLQTFSYAVVLQDPSHLPDQQPYFSFRVKTLAGMTIVCPTYSVSAAGGIPGFQTVNSSGGTVVYKDWTTVAMNLFSYIGQTVTFEFTAGDCSQGGHYGYAYVDASCSAPEITSSNELGLLCPGDSLVLTAEQGGGASGMSFLWSTGDTTASITADTSGTYTVSIIPPTGITCEIPLQKVVTITHLLTNAIPTVNKDTACINETLQFIDASTASPATADSIIGWKWDFGDGTPVANVKDTTHTYASNGTYNVTLTVTTDAGCTDDSTFTIVILPTPSGTWGIVPEICQNDPQAQLTFTGANGSAPYTFTYSVNGGAPQTITTTSGNSIALNVPTNSPDTLNYHLISVADVNSATGCINTPSNIDTSIVIHPLPVGTISAGDSVCKGSATIITLTGTSGTSNSYTFTYNDANGASQNITSNGSGTATINPPTNTVGTFNYQLTSIKDNGTGCINNIQNETSTIFVNPLPSATITGVSDVCIDDAMPTLTFKGTDGVAPYTFSYKINNGPTQTVSTTGSSDIATVSVPTNASGTFTYTIVSVNSSGSLSCIDPNTNISHVINIRPYPVVEAGANFNACRGQQITLAIPGNDTYTWDHGVTNNVPFAIDSTTTYSVVATTQYGCVANDEITVSVNAPTVSFSASDTTGCFPLKTNFTNNSTGAVSYLWTLGNGSTSTAIEPSQVVFNKVGCHDVTLLAKDSNGCTTQLTLKNYICVYPNPIVEFIASPSTISAENNTVLFVNKSVGGVSYAWNYGDSSAIDTTFQPSHTFDTDSASNYIVTLYATSAFGCTDSASQTIKIKNDVILYIPNSFTPNGDEYNNLFQPILGQGLDVHNYEMTIYNRWGQAIFKTKDAKVGWDGTYDGKACSDGIYVWKIIITTNEADDVIIKTGHVNLLR